MFRDVESEFRRRRGRAGLNDRSVGGPPTRGGDDPEAGRAPGQNNPLPSALKPLEVQRADGYDQWPRTPGPSTGRRPRAPDHTNRADTPEGVGR
jgi:hypothetical protein